MCTPVFKALKDKYPLAAIILQTKSPELVQNNPYLSSIIQHSDKRAYDLDYTLCYEKEPGKNRIDTMAKQAKVTLKSRKMEVFFRKIERKVQDKYIVVHTGKSWPNRMWPMDKWSRLIKAIVKKYSFQVCFVGTKETDIITGTHIYP